MASAMLDEMPVAAVTLNALSRRVGLAKPNVLRYFESREAVLLELLDRFLQEWLTELAGELAAGIDENSPMAERAAAVAEILSRSLSGRVVLCDLFGALSAYSTPPPSLQAAYQAEPDLARFHLELKDYLKLALTATLLGVLPRR